jgi:hypothetical protein
MNNQNVQPKVIPEWMVWVQCVCFAVLYAIWALPETILIRHICLITGALLSVWIIFQYRHLFLSRRATPVWLIIGLFIWATFHLFFLSQDFVAQYAEYTSIWKRTAIGAVFALGFGISLTKFFRGNSLRMSKLWWLLYVGLLLPTIIYVIKFILTFKAQGLGVPVPGFLVLFSGSARFYVPKTAYVCFCLLALSVALGQLIRNINQHLFLSWENTVYLVSILMVLFVFDAESIKNGVFYSILLLILFMCFLVFQNFHEKKLIKLSVLVAILFVGGALMVNSIHKNNSWRALIVDAKTAFKIDENDQWKYAGEKGYPQNELGITVHATNYERIAWGFVGLRLVANNPMGYGLVERSFGRLAKNLWPESRMHQSHSGWVDLSLGIGLPGVALIFLSITLLLIQHVRRELSFSISSGGGCCSILDAYSTMIWWGLLSLLMMWCTTEISQKVYFENLIFWVTMASGSILTLNSD